MIFADFIQNTGFKRVDIGGREILTEFKRDFEDVKNFTESKMGKYEVVKEQFQSDKFTQEYRVQELTKAIDIVDKNISDFINKKVLNMKDKYELALKQSKVKNQDENISRNNLIKISTLGDLSEDNIKELFEFSKDKDINVIMVLQVQAEKKELTELSEQIKEYINDFTCAKELNYIKKEIEEMESLKSYLQCRVIENFGVENGYLSGINTIMSDYIDQIDNIIKTFN